MRPDDHGGSPCLAERFAPSFASAKPDGSDAQITDFCFCAASVRLDEQRTFEAMIMAQPRLSKSRGLEFGMVLSAAVCEPNSCEELFARDLDASSCAALCASKSPIADAFIRHPGLMEKAIALAPGLREALEADERSALVKALRRAAKPAATSRKAPRI